MKQSGHDLQMEDLATHSELKSMWAMIDNSPIAHYVRYLGDEFSEVELKEAYTPEGLQNRLLLAKTTLAKENSCGPYPERIFNLNRWKNKLNEVIANNKRQNENLEHDPFTYNVMAMRFYYYFPWHIQNEFEVHLNNRVSIKELRKLKKEAVQSAWAGDSKLWMEIEKSSMHGVLSDQSIVNAYDKYDEYFDEESQFEEWESFKKDFYAAKLAKWNKYASEENKKFKIKYKEERNCESKMGSQTTI